MDDNTNTSGSDTSGGGVLKTPTTINDIDGAFVIAYCKAQGQAGTDWLKQIYSTPPKKDKNGVEREISFLQVRNEFARKYFPHLAPQRKTPKKKTIKNLLDEL